MTMQKIGYDGTYLMELANTGDAGSGARGARGARAAVRTRHWHMHDCLHRRHRPARRAGRHARGLAAQPALERQDPLPDLRDGTGFIQCVMSKQAVGEEAFKQADHLVAGKRRSSSTAPCAPTRARQAASRSTSPASRSSPKSQDYPITPKEHGVDFLMDRRHLWIRSQRQQAILRVRHEVINAVRDFFNERGFILADTPIFTPAACEGTTTLFPVQYFDDETAYLTQSGQLYNEANAMALGRVYCFGPTFRAEKSKTRRHLTEFWMVEPEMAYATLDDVMELAEALVVSVVARVLERRADRS